MTGQSRDRFVRERAYALATIILTRRGDLILTDTKRETCLDLHVTIDREDKSMRLTFGILLRGVSSSVTIDHANKILAPTMSQFLGMRKFTYPVCLFFFSMRDDRAYFTWLAEPILTENGPKLVHHDTPGCIELTDQLLDRTIDQIVEWYDAVESVLIA